MVTHSARCGLEGRTHLVPLRLRGLHRRVVRRLAPRGLHAEAVELALQPPRHQLVGVERHLGADADVTTDATLYRLDTEPVGNDTGWRQRDGG